MSQENRAELIERILPLLDQWAASEGGLYFVELMDVQPGPNSCTTAMRINAEGAANMVGLLIDHFGTDVVQMVLRDKQHQKKTSEADGKLHLDTLTLNDETVH